MLAKKDAEMTVRQVIGLSSVLTVLLVLVSYASSKFLIRTFLKPMRELTAGISAIAAGRLDRRVKVISRDEFGELAKGFNYMVMELQQERSTLELRVEERTEELLHLVIHDTLTGLHNRAGFNQKFEDGIKSARRRDAKLALLLLDLDGFKSINDTMGHDIGDILLQEVARRLQAQVRDVDVVARIGGDEFFLLLLDMTGYQLAAEVAARALESMSSPIQLAGRAIGARASIGIAIYPDDAENSVELFKAADSAMHADVSKRLSDIGVRVAIDDFGTGFSSLTVLKSMNARTVWSRIGQPQGGKKAENSTCRARRLSRHRQ